MRWTQIAFVVGFNVLFVRCDWVIAVVITFHARSGWRDARSVQYQTRDMLAQRDSSLARCPLWFVAYLPVIDTYAEMLGMQSTDAIATGCDSLARIDMNNSGTRQARAVQSGLKESPIAMGQSRDNNAMNPSRISRRF